MSKLNVSGSVMFRFVFRRVCDCWAVISTDVTFTCDILDSFKKILKTSQVYEKQENGEVSKTVVLQPLQVNSSHISINFRFSLVK